MSAPTWHHCEQSCWSNSFPAAAGNRQSPIDFVTASVKHQEFAKLVIKEVVVKEEKKDVNWKLSNNGRTIAATPSSESVKFVISGGPLSSEYDLNHFHLHWGRVTGEGAEHLVDGVQYDAEAHFVCTRSKGENKNDYDEDFVVLGVFIKQVDNLSGDSTLDEVLRNAGKILSPGEVDIPSVDFQKILPLGERSYFTYPGSLTTPPCSEKVRFFIYEGFVELSAAAFGGLRDMKDQDGKEIAPNFRHIQPLNGRTVEQSK